METTAVSFGLSGNLVQKEMGPKQIFKKTTQASDPEVSSSKSKEVMVSAKEAQTSKKSEEEKQTMVNLKIFQFGSGELIRGFTKPSVTKVVTMSGHRTHRLLNYQLRQRKQS